MAEGKSTGGGDGGGGGLLDLEKELTCSICTDILYQPLTLLDCLHTFCGGCLKEWFSWQAHSAANGARRATTSPYNCPSCRESVRDTKADWRLTTLLEGYLKANPGKGKSEEEKEEMRAHYKTGDNVLPPVLSVQRIEEDSEDERLIRDVMELSMANVDPDTARRRSERASRERQRRRQERRQGPGELAGYQENSRRAAQQAEQQQEHADDRQIEHQPSLRSLLSNSDISSEDVQEEILQSIHSEGLLNGIDIDNLTPAQEEELTERIAEAYRRRQRHRDRSRNRNRQSDNTPPRTEPRTTTPPIQQPQTRSRPPISRPHLFEQQVSAGSERSQRRSASSTSHQRVRQSESRSRTSSNAAPAARSATDLSDTAQRSSRPRASSSNTRSVTDPPRMRDDIRRVRVTSNTLRPDSAEAVPRPRGRDARSSEPVRRQTAPVDADQMLVPEARSVQMTSTPPQQQPEVRSTASVGALAPVPVATEVVQPPSISCSRCQRTDIAAQLHYNCPKCDSGNFHLCLRCYREGKGCHNWYGFGSAAWMRWQQALTQDNTLERPHILMPQKQIPASHSSAPEILQGAFCEICHSHANACYWYCNTCLSGAWGFCNACVLRGKHCTHPLLPIAHISTLRNSPHDPSKLSFLPIPHLTQDSYIHLPVLTDCDICQAPIPPPLPRFHCYNCNSGDYDICTPCYNSLVSTGKISPSNGPNAWRRCLKNHRMVIITYHSPPTTTTTTTTTPSSSSYNLRLTLRDPVGGFRLREDPTTLSGQSPIPQEDTGGGGAGGGGGGMTSLANWSFWPLTVEEGGDGNDLSFPRGAEIKEVEERNEDWSVGVYCGKVGVFPTNHTVRM